MGAALAGVADTARLGELRTDPADLLKPFSRALAMAVPLPAAVFEAIADRPTPIYASIYKTANRLLDEIAFKTAMALQQAGYPRPTHTGLPGA